MKLCEWLMFGPINAFASSTRSIDGHKRGHRFIESIRRIVSYLLDSFEIVGQKKDSLKQFFLKRILKAFDKDKSFLTTTKL